MPSTWPVLPSASSSTAVRSTGAAITPGDTILGIASPNLRSNGFSLVRASLLGTSASMTSCRAHGRTVADVVLEPSVIYTPAIVDLVAKRRRARPGACHGRRPARQPSPDPAGELRRPHRHRTPGSRRRSSTPSAARRHPRRRDVPHLQHGHRFRRGASARCGRRPARELLGSHGHETYEIGEIVTGHGTAVLS